jgi:single-strand DNA-binding protein
MDNTVTVSGNLTREPELRYTPTGRAVCNLGVAVNRRYQVNGEWQEQVSFIDVTAWADLAEHLASCLTKGARVVVTGRLEQRSWETDEGEKRSKTEIVADDVGASLRFANVTVERIERAHPQVATPAYTPEEPF